MKHYTATFLINAAKSYVKADNVRMCERPDTFCRGAWRTLNPIEEKNDFLVYDSAYKTKPKRIFSIHNNPYFLTVWSMGFVGRIIETIDLRNEDADTKLQRYEVADWRELKGTKKMTKTYINTVSGDACTEVEAIDDLQAENTEREFVDLPAQNFDDCFVEVEADE